MRGGSATPILAKLCFAFYFVALTTTASFGQCIGPAPVSQIVTLTIKGQLTDAQGVPIRGTVSGLARWDARDWADAALNVWKKFGDSSSIRDYAFVELRRRCISTRPDVETMAGDNERSRK